MGVTRALHRVVGSSTPRGGSCATFGSEANPSVPIPGAQVQQEDRVRDRGAPRSKAAAPHHYSPFFKRATERGDAQQDQHDRDDPTAMAAGCSDAWPSLPSSARAGAADA